MDLELRLAALRQKNSVSLNRPHLEEQIRSVSARLDRWREIRAMIEREQSGRRTQQPAMMNAQDGLLSLRALVARIEERTQRLVETSAETVARVGTVVDTDAVRLLRGEVAALCQYLTWHEQQCERHTETMLSMTAERSLADGAQMIQLLEGQIQTLRLEQGRAENVLQESSLPAMAVTCSFTGHRELPATLLTNGYGSTELEAQIAAATTRTALEDLYAPYKQKRRTRGCRGRRSVSARTCLAASASRRGGVSSGVPRSWRARCSSTQGDNSGSEAGLSHAAFGVVSTNGYE